jgi:hypothetical protein
LRFPRVFLLLIIALAFRAGQSNFGPVDLSQFGASEATPGRKRFEVHKNLATQVQVALAFTTLRTMARKELLRPRLGNHFLVVLMGVPDGMLWRPSRVLMRAKFVDWPRKHGTQLSPDPISTPLPLGHWNSGWKWMA